MCLKNSQIICLSFRSNLTISSSSTQNAVYYKYMAAREVKEKSQKQKEC